MGAFEAIAAERGINWTAKEIGQLVARKAERLEGFAREDSVLFPGALAAIRTSAEALPIAIASGALGAEIRRVLDYAGLTAHFTAIVAAEDTPFSKPAPDPYLRAVSWLSSARGPLSAADCVAVEDSRWGLQSARAAGHRTVAVAHTYHADELQEADMILPTIQAFDLRALQRRFAD